MLKPMRISDANGNALPAYRRIQNAIRKKIEDGKLKPGELVDSERELARVHGVSLMTARHALAELQREGLVERHRGSGTYVAPPKIEFNKLTSFTEQMAGRSTRAQLERGSLFILLEKDYQTRIAYADEDVDATVADPKTAALLRLPHGAPLLRIRQTIFSGDGKPMLYVLGLYRSDRHVLHIRRFR